jgi:hypothetical protein
MAEREGMGRHGGEVRSPRRRRVRLLREKAPDLSGGGGEGGGDSGHPGEGDQTPVAHSGQAAEWESRSDREGRPKERPWKAAFPRECGAGRKADAVTCPAHRDHGGLTAQNRLVSGPATPTELGFPDIINGPTRKCGREFSNKNFPRSHKKIQ